MFDDQQTGAQDPQQNSNPTPPTPAPAPTPPKEEDSKDSFGEVITMPKPGEKAERPSMDPSADKPAVPVTPTPTPATSAPVSAVPKASDMPTPMAPRMGMEPVGKKKSKGLLIVVIAVLVIVILGVGGYIAYTLMSPESDVEKNIILDTEEDTIVPVEVVEDIVEPIIEVPVVEEPEIDLTKIDTDGDGLMDAEEIFYNTSISLADTDRDGLDDYEEVMTYETDPNIEDSDGDGFLDGEEVSNGYDPNGPGKLLNLDIQ